MATILITGASSGFGFASAPAYNPPKGSVGERFNPPVLKTGDGASRP